MIVVVTDEAGDDLEDIAKYIGLSNPTRAVDFVGELRKRCDQLIEMPERFQRVPGFEESGVRRVPHGEYIVFYRVKSEVIEILHILNGARNWEDVLFPG